MVSIIYKLEKAKEDILYRLGRYGEDKAYNVSKEDSYQTDNNNFRECRLVMKELANKKVMRIPEFIKESRTIDEAVECLIQQADINQLSDSNLKNYLSRSFNEYIDYVEEKHLDIKIIHVEPKMPEELTYTTILDLIDKCETRINIGDYSGAVTSAKTLVEGVCKEILKKFPDVEVKNSEKLTTLFSLVREKLSLNPGDPKLDNSLKQVLTGLISIVSGISEIRNTYGDSHLYTNLIKEHHALVVVNSAKTIVNFLFGTYSYQLERGTLIKS